MEKQEIMNDTILTNQAFNKKQDLRMNLFKDLQTQELNGIKVTASKWTAHGKLQDKAAANQFKNPVIKFVMNFCIDISVAIFISGLSLALLGNSNNVDQIKQYIQQDQKKAYIFIITCLSVIVWKLHNLLLGKQKQVTQPSSRKLLDFTLDITKTALYIIIIIFIQPYVWMHLQKIQIKLSFWLFIVALAFFVFRKLIKWTKFYGTQQGRNDYEPWTSNKVTNQMVNEQSMNLQKNMNAKNIKQALLAGKNELKQVQSNLKKVVGQQKFDLIKQNVQKIKQKHGINNFDDLKNIKLNKQFYLNTLKQITNNKIKGAFSEITNSVPKLLNQKIQNSFSLLNGNYTQQVTKAHKIFDNILDQVNKKFPQLESQTLKKFKEQKNSFKNELIKKLKSQLQQKKQLIKNQDQLKQFEQLYNQKIELMNNKLDQLFQESKKKLPIKLQPLKVNPLNQI